MSRIVSRSGWVRPKSCILVSRSNISVACHDCLLGPAGDLATSGNSCTSKSKHPSRTAHCGCASPVHPVTH